MVQVEKYMTPEECRLLAMDRKIDQLLEQIQMLQAKLSFLQDSVTNHDPTRTDESNEHWIQKVEELAAELVRDNGAIYSCVGSVFSSVQTILQTSYGIVVSQLRKDFQKKYDTLRNPSAMEAIADNPMSRDVFYSVLKNLFPEYYWFPSDSENVRVIANNATLLNDILKPLAEKRNDHSDNYEETFRLVCENMDCSWHNLQVRYRKKSGSLEDPDYRTLLLSNQALFRKFKKSLKNILDSVVSE